MDNTQLIETSVQQGQGLLSRDGALIVRTGASTGRSTKERFIVCRSELKDDIDWGEVNQPMDESTGDLFFQRLEQKVGLGPYFEDQEFVGCFKVKVRSLSSWHVAFALNMFRDNFIQSLREQVPEEITIQIFHDPYGRVSDLGLELPFEKAIVLDPVQMKVGIIGTAYAGEIKKSAFTLCNFAFPKYGLLPMHASANCNFDGTGASVLFGLSGTGKTTLSADPQRYLIGDDEIVWSSQGLSNLEGGCYAKLIHLDREKEPDIFSAANRFGSILENVSYHPDTREIDFDSEEVTENTRGSYSLSALENVFTQETEAKAPQSIVFLTADAFGALPAVAKLDSWQTQYHFISGYTAKVAGTEMGVTEPKATFSACFGAPFMPRPASVYARLLSQFVEQQGASVWLLNTGWTKGNHQTGERFPIPVSRRLLTAIQSGALDHVEMVTHPIFGFQVPLEVPGVDKEWLKIPKGPEVLSLAKEFIANGKSMTKDQTFKELIDRGGPHIPC